MNTFYSILYVPIRPSLDEKVSIALFVKKGDEIFFQYSGAKLAIIKALLPDSAFSLLKSYLKNIQKRIEEIQIGNPEELNFHEDNSIRFIEEKYFNYLSDYSNNLISFSRPKSINLPINQETFERLFEKYVFELETLTVSPQKPDVVQQVKDALYPKIEPRVNIDKRLTQKEIPCLFAPISIDFIGKNQIPVAGNTFDFLKKSYSLESDIARFVSLIKAFELNGNDKGTYYVIGTEPSKTEYPEQHYTWKAIYESPLFTFVPVEETQTIADYMDRHDVKPFFEKAENE